MVCEETIKRMFSLREMQNSSAAFLRRTQGERSSAWEKGPDIIPMASASIRRLRVRLAFSDTPLACEIGWGRRVPCDVQTLRWVPSQAVLNLTSSAAHEKTDRVSSLGRFFLMSLVGCPVAFQVKECLAQGVHRVLDQRGFETKLSIN